MSVVTSALFGGLGAAGIFGGGGGSSSPSYGNAGKQYLKMLNAIAAGAPQQLSLEQQYKPQYTKLDLQDIANQLNGMNGTPGYLDLYTQDVVPAISRAQTGANTALRTANVADVRNLGPGAAGAVRSINPQNTALLDSLTKTATDQLALGDKVDPATASRITSTVRGNWADRGLGSAPAAQLDEALQLYGGGQAALAQRENAAASAANLGYNLETLPALDTITGTSAAPAQGQALGATSAQMGTNAGPTLYNTQDLESLLNSLMNANSAAQIAGGNNQAAVTGSLLGAGSQLGSAALMGLLL